MIRSSSSLSSLPIDDVESTGKEPKAAREPIRETPVKEILLKKRALEKASSLGRSLSIVVSDSALRRAHAGTLGGSMRATRGKFESTFKDLGPDGPPDLELIQENEDLLPTLEPFPSAPGDLLSPKHKKKLLREASEGTLRKKKHTPEHSPV